MKELFLIGEAAKLAHTTSETLRHYDRIGLVKPSKKDEWNGYRYYTKQDLVRVQTIRALQQMDLPLHRIQEVLEYNDLEKIIAFLEEAEQKADEKIAAIEQSKLKIRLAKRDYEAKLRAQHRSSQVEVRRFPERFLLLSDTLETPTLDNLWNYLHHFYAMVPEHFKGQELFEDVAGVYTKDGRSRMFAVCTHPELLDDLVTLPAGDYLCAECTEETRAEQTAQLLRVAKEEYEAEPEFTVHQVVVSGILQWQYQIQLYLGFGR